MGRKGGVRNPYAAAHSMRGGAGAGAHRDRRRTIEEGLADPYSQEWIDACPRGGACDTSVTDGDMGEVRPLSREFLLSRGWCCDMGCVNCPYRETPPAGPAGGE